ncbi:MAG: glycosyltransferase family 9 protein [Candidatus Omnitrophota bacterium]
MIDKTAVKKILFITLSNIGDVVLTLPVMGALRENFRQASIDVIVGPRAKEIFKDDPRIEKTYIYDKTDPFLKRFGFLSLLKKGKYDLVVDLRNSLFGFFVGGRFWNKPLLGFRGDAGHKMDAHLRKLSLLGLEAVSKPYPIWISRSDAEIALSLLNMAGIRDSDNIVCVAPGAMSHIKRWPEANFAKVCDRLIDELNVKILMVGDLEDKEICDRIADSMKNSAVSIAGKTNLPQLTWCLKRSRLLITNDSAPLHIAGSVLTPSVAIFGPTDYRKYGPRQGLGFAAHKKLHCSPCEAALCKYNLECMKAIGTGEVFEMAKEILNEKK